MLNILTVTLRTYPSTASILSLFKHKKLNQFTSFVDFLIRKIYPIGFTKWNKLDNKKGEVKLHRLEEKWHISQIKDTKPDPNSNQDNKYFAVRWDRNMDWEAIIVDNMRTLIDYNVFMSPQEKKVKLDIKKHLINGLLEKTLKLVGPSNLRDLVSLCTSLIMLKKLLSPSDYMQPLYYNDENVLHTIKELKTNNQIFKILSDLMKTINPISSEAEILDDILLPLIQKCTMVQIDFSSKKSPLQANQPQHNPINQPEIVEDLEDLEDIDIDIEEDNDDDDQNNDLEDEEDEEEQEDEDQPEPYVEENATHSDNLSLDDMIEELEYGQEGDNESEINQNQDNDLEDESEGDDEIMHDEQRHDYMDNDIDIASEADFEPMDADLVNNHNPLIARIPNEDNESDAYDYPHDRHDAHDEAAFNMIDMDENPFEDRINLEGRRMGHHRHHLDAHDDIEHELGEMGFYEFVNFLRRRDRDRPYGANPFIRNHRRGYDINFGHREGRISSRVARTNLESLFSIDRNNNDEDFWNANIVNHPVVVNRNRSQRSSDDFDDPRDALNGIIARDINDIHNRISNNPFMNRARQRERDPNSQPKTSNNPFDIIK